LLFEATSTDDCDNMRCCGFGLREASRFSFGHHEALILERDGRKHPGCRAAHHSGTGRLSSEASAAWVIRIHISL